LPLVLATFGAALGLTPAACSADRPPEPLGETMGKTEQPLSASNFVGTSVAAKTLALTFDDGPGDRTAELSMYLKAQGIRAAFFVNGGRIAATALPNPNGLTPLANVNAVLAQLVADGHLVANHTTTHRDLVSTVANGQRVQELMETDASIAAYVPSGWFLFRAPFGSYNGAVYNTLHASGMDKYIGPIYWDMGDGDSAYPNSAADWACWSGQQRNAAGGGLVNGTGYATTAQCGDAYLNNINAVGKGIVLMHDPYSWANGSTVDMVKYLVPKLKAAGYSFVRVDDVPAIRAALPPCDATCATCSGVAADQCASCKPGRYLAGTSCMACSTCGANEYESAACTITANTSCTACTTCAAGTYEATACAAQANTVCTPCAAGTFASAPGAKACVACGSCDDGDACTTDACDPVKGCTHTPIPGCTPPVDGGASSSSGSTSSGGGSSGGSSGGGSSGGGSSGGGSSSGESSTSSGGSSPPPGDDGGCSVASTRADGGLAALLLGLALAPLVRRRRSRVA